MRTHEKTITATEFKAKCLRILEELTPEGLIITKRGKPIARVLPTGGMTKGNIVGSMQRDIRIHGDIFSTGVQWDAQS